MSTHKRTGYSQRVKQLSGYADLSRLTRVVGSPLSQHEVNEYKRRRYNDGKIGNQNNFSFLGRRCRTVPSPVQSLVSVNLYSQNSISKEISELSLENSGAVHELSPVPSPRTLVHQIIPSRLSGRKRLNHTDKNMKAKYMRDSG